MTSCIFRLRQGACMSPAVWGRYIALWDVTCLAAGSRHSAGAMPLCLGQWQGTLAPTLTCFAGHLQLGRLSPCRPGLHLDSQWWTWDLSTVCAVQVLEARMDVAGMDKERYKGYLELREFGSTPHSGFGMGLERLVMFATGLDNIQEAIPFPCTPGHAPS